LETTALCTWLTKTIGELRTLLDRPGLTEPQKNSPATAHYGAAATTLVAGGSQVDDAVRRARRQCSCSREMFHRISQTSNTSRVTAFLSGRYKKVDGSAEDGPKGVARRHSELK
jgi:hypothetical protein